MVENGFNLLGNRERFGVVITLSGPGAENSMGGLVQAFADNIPFLYLPAGPPLGQRSVRPNFSPARTYQSVSKLAEVVYSPESVAAVMRLAFHALRNGRPGPVTVDIPADVGTMNVPEAVLDYQPPKRSPQLPTPGISRKRCGFCWQIESRSYGRV